MKKMLILGLFLFSSISTADSFCAKGARDIIEDLKNSENRLAFLNEGGLINGGVCWWHSRFTRAAALIAKFKPEKQKPGYHEVKKIIHAITRMDKVVEIPGYANLFEFSKENQFFIQHELEKWQKLDGFLRQRWVVGLAGKTRSSADRTKKRFDLIVDAVQNLSEPLFLKLQYAGIASHAAIVVGAEKKSDEKGAYYDLTIIDSNYKQLQHMVYREGDVSIGYVADDIMVYLNFNHEIAGMMAARNTYCAN